jgi:hypothetical protein
MGRIFFLIVVLSTCMEAAAQTPMPAYTIYQDSATHITVIHIDNSELRRIKTDTDTMPLSLISPDVKLKNGRVDHKAMTGELYVREVFVDSVLIGYIEYDGTNMKREVFYNSDGNIFLEKRYRDNNEVYLNDKVQVIKRKENDGTNSK